MVNVTGSIPPYWIAKTKWRFAHGLTTYIPTHYVQKMLVTQQFPTWRRFKSLGLYAINLKY